MARNDSPAFTLNDKRIVLGITSGIAAYKTPMLVRALRAAGADVQVVLSDHAHEFVTATALQAVSGHPVRQSLWDADAEAAMGHIELAKWADLILIAPATANCIANLAHGHAHDLLTTLCLATDAPVAIAPAMNQAMYRHPATVANLQGLNALGYALIGPESGDQACGDDGPGRMTEPDDIVAALPRLLGASAPILAGQHVTITAGPTVEAIDPVRFISNHSSGKQGLSLAAAARAAGAQVTLIAGPGVPATPPDIDRIDVVSALEMLAAVERSLPRTDIFIGVAAVADYRPKHAAEEKIKRSGEANRTRVVELEENPDIIATVAAARPKPLVIGFAAETHEPLEHARAKRKRKGLDAIVLNDVSDTTIGFNSDHNAATLIYDQGEIEFPRQPKAALAHALIENIVEIFSAKLAHTSAQTRSL